MPTAALGVASKYLIVFALGATVGWTGHACWQQTRRRGQALMVDSTSSFSQEPLSNQVALINKPGVAELENRNVLADGQERDRKVQSCKDLLAGTGVDTAKKLRMPSVATKLDETDEKCKEKLDESVTRMKQLRKDSMMYKRKFQDGQEAKGCKQTPVTFTPPQVTGPSEQRFEDFYLFWRKAAGTLSCELYDIGPTGGFCRSRLKPSLGGGAKIGASFAHELGGVFDGSTVIDIGCGLGQYGRFFEKEFPKISWVGLDGSESIEDATNGFVKFADLVIGLPTKYQHAWDWVMSIEVAEHIPRAAEPIFMHTIVRWATKGIILSWARLGQGGNNHVNCQSREYIQCAMGLMGMGPDEKLQKQLAHAAASDIKLPWIAENVHAFVPLAQRQISLSGLTLGPLPDVADKSFAESYFQMTEKHCNPALKTSCFTPTTQAPGARSNIQWAQNRAKTRDSYG